MYVAYYTIRLLSKLSERNWTKAYNENKMSNSHIYTGCRQMHLFIGKRFAKISPNDIDGGAVFWPTR